MHVIHAVCDKRVKKNLTPRNVSRENKVQRKTRICDTLKVLDAFVLGKTSAKTHAEEFFLANLPRTQITLKGS